jgi:hypothetical protein
MGVLAGTMLLFSPQARAALFPDGFENESTISNFWTKTGPGSVTLTNSLAHSGTTSADIAVSSTFPWNAGISHSFGSEVTGSASVFMYSNLTGSGSSADLAITRANGDTANIQALGTGGFQARVCTGAGQTPLCENGVFASGADVKWHQFEIDTDEHGITIKLDGIALVNDPSIDAFQQVSVGVWGSPSGSADFDDFLAVATPVVTDSFENESTIGNFWTKTGPGSVTLTKSIAHSGTQSADLAVSSSSPWSVTISHNFGSEVTGAVSVFVHGNLTGSSSSADLAITRANGDVANIQQLGTGGFQARVCTGNHKTSLCGTGVFFTGANLTWHQFEIDTDQNGITIKLDGVAMVTDPSIAAFQQVSVGVWGSPSGSADFDDFQAVL